MTVKSDKVTRGEKELWTKYPEESGLIVGTTRQEGREIALIPEEQSLVFSKDKIGLDI